MKVNLELLPSQDEFIFSDTRFPAIVGGWGCGKTTAGCLKAFLHCQENPNNLFVIARQDYTDLRDSTLRDFMDLFSRAVDYNRADKVAKLKSNGSEILFRHASELNALKNINLGGFWVDQAEEITEEAFLFLVGRLRRKNIKNVFGAITANQDGHNWIWERWKKNKLENYHLIEATTYENSENLPAAYVESLEDLPDILRRRFVENSWDVFEGQIYDELREDVHFINPFPIPKQWARGVTIDPALAGWTGVTFHAVNSDGIVFQYDEHYEKGKIVEHHANIIHEKVSRDSIDQWLIDPAAFGKTMEKKGQLWSFIDEYRDHGIFPQAANNDVLAGINRVKEYFKIDIKRINPITQKRGSPKLFIFKNCVHTWNELTQYRWQKLKPQQEGRANDPEKPVKVKDHLCDATRYYIMSRPSSENEKKSAPHGSFTWWLKREKRKKQEDFL